MKRKCIVCGKVFEGSHDKIYCPQCAEKIKKNVLRDRVCKQCGVTFKGGPRAWYCPKCREERQKKRDREHYERKKMGNVRHIGSVDICVNCGKKYTVESSNQRYCKDCVEKVVAENCRKESLEYSIKHRDYLNDQRNSKREQAQVQKYCDVCGKPLPLGSLRDICSDECATIRQREWQRKGDQKREGGRYAKLKASMTDEEWQKYREKMNKKARENYAKRKRRKEND